MKLSLIEQQAEVGDRQLHQKDINGVSILPGCLVETQQAPGGVLPRGKTRTGRVFCTKDAIGAPTIGIKGDKGSTILIAGHVNKVISTVADHYH